MYCPLRLLQATTKSLESQAPKDPQDTLAAVLHPSPLKLDMQHPPESCQELHHSLQ